MTTIPLEVLIPQVFFVPGGILPIGLHGDGGSIVGSLHGYEYHLGLNVQVSFHAHNEESTDQPHFTWEQVKAQPD